MKLKVGFVVREVAGQTVVLPTGSDLDLNMMMLYLKQLIHLYFLLMVLNMR